MKIVKILSLSLGVVAALVVSNAQAQAGVQLLVNGKPFDEKGCQKLPELKSVAIANLEDDSVGVHISLAHGMRGTGAKGFTSITAFNSFNLPAWLYAEKGDGKSGNINLDDNGDSFTKYKAQAGSRLLIQLFSYKKAEKKSKMYKVQFCVP